jgi:serine/threonine-protein kinase
MRILIGVGAWLLGAGTATAGSLLAVSLLGQGIADSPGQQLSEAAINSALAHEAGETSGTADRGAAGRSRADPGPVSLPLPRPSVTQAPATRPAATRSAADRTVPSPSPASAQTTAPSTQASAGTVLTSAGGTVLAQCRTQGAYLVSWSPSQGYEAGQVLRGPATTAQVTFESVAGSVTMVVSCPAGVPTATSSATRGDE